MKNEIKISKNFAGLELKDGVYIRNTVNNIVGGAK